MARRCGGPGNALPYVEQSTVSATILSLHVHSPGLEAILFSALDAS
jgi:hypothetical protein